MLKIPFKSDQMAFIFIIPSNKGSSTFWKMTPSCFAIWTIFDKFKWVFLSFAKNVENAWLYMWNLGMLTSF